MCVCVCGRPDDGRVYYDEKKEEVEKEVEEKGKEVDE